MSKCRLELFINTFIKLGMIGLPQTQDEATEFMVQALNLYLIVGTEFNMDRIKLAECTKESILKYPFFNEANNVN